MSTHANKGKKRKAYQPKRANNVTQASAATQLNELEIQCQRMLGEAAALGPILKRPELHPFYSNITLVTEQTRILTKDLQHYHGELRRLGELKRELNIQNVNPDNVMEAMDLGQGFYQWIESFQCVVLPRIATLSDEITAANNKLNASKGDAVNEQ